MSMPQTIPATPLPGSRSAPLAMAAEEFRVLGRWLVDRIAEHLESLPGQAVARDEPPSAVREALGSLRTLPGDGVAAEEALKEAAELLFGHSTFNGHPRFFGYIT